MSVKSATAFGLTSSLEPGLVLLNTTSFSGVASVSLAANTFTTTYDRYKVFFNVSSVSANNQLQFRLRKAGTDSSTGYHYGNQAHRSNNTANNYGAANDPAWFFYDMQSAYNNEVNFELTFILPATSTPTSIFVVGAGMDGSNNTMGYTAGCTHRVSDTYDSATFLSQAGATMTGSYSVYGLNK